MPLAQPPTPSGPRPGWTRNALSAWDVIATAAGVVIAPLIMVTLLGGMLQAATSDRTVLQISLYAIQTLTVLGVIWLVLIRLRGHQWSDLGIAPASLTWARVGLLTGILMVPLVYLLVNLAHQIVGGAEPRGSGVTLPPAGTLLYWTSFLTLFLYFGILVPVAEELFFRGVLFNWLRSRFDFWPANIATALIFGLLHRQGVEINLALGIASLALGWLFERSGSLIPAIIAHQTFNIAGMMLLLFGSAGG